MSRLATLRLIAGIDPTPVARARSMRTFQTGIPWLIDLCRHEPDAVTFEGKTVIQRLREQLLALTRSTQSTARESVRKALAERCS